MHSKVHVFSTRSCRFFSATCVWESCRSLSVFFQQKRRENSHLVLIFFQQHVFGKAVEAFPFFSTKTKRKFTFSVDFFSATCVWESCRSLSVFFQQKRRENSHLVLIFFQQHVFGKAVEAFPFFFQQKGIEKIHI